MTTGTGALHIAIRQEHLFVRIECLADGAFGDVPGRLQAGVNQFGEIAIFLRVGQIIIVETDAEIGKIRPVLTADVFDELFGAQSRFIGFEHNGGAVGVVGAHIGNMVAAGTLVTHPDVRLDVFHQVTDMNRTIGIRQGAGNQDPAGSV